MFKSSEFSHDCVNLKKCSRQPFCSLFWLWPDSPVSQHLIKLSSTLLFYFRNTHLIISNFAGAPTDLEGQLSEWEWRIVGGSNAASNAAPYQASLRSTLNAHICGGTVITDRTILTAAHCVTGYEQIIKKIESNVIFIL